jgi:diguanylate cyclase
MRYTEPKEKSAELLRLALAQMGKHTAAYNPLTFTLWYEYVAGTNARLAAAVDALTTKSVLIDDERVLTLCKQHVFPANEDSLERVRSALDRLMQGVARTAQETSLHAGDYGAKLSELNNLLTGEDASRIQPQVDDVLAGTARMRASVDQLRTEVETSHQEVNRLRAELDRARGEAMLDPLTGVLNRRGFEQHLQAMLAEKPPEGSSHVLVMLDIDHFKKVNDTHGHLMGDRVIQGLGEILRSTVKTPRATAARYGGEEFAILLPHTSLDESHQLSETVRTRTKALKIRNRSTQEVLVTVTVSGGVAAWKPGEAANDLIARADAALYASKQAGRDRITLA